jgi:hypothetical protein
VRWACPSMDTVSGIRRTIVPQSLLEAVGAPSRLDGPSECDRKVGAGARWRKPADIGGARQYPARSSADL